MTAPDILEESFVLKWRFGVRAAMLVAEEARRFQSKIALEHDGRRYDAKDNMSMMMVGTRRPKLPDGSYNFGPDAGARMRVFVSGPDARAAMTELRELFTCGETVIQCRNTDCISSAILIGYSRTGIIYSCSNNHIWFVHRETGKVVAPRPPTPVGR